MRHPTLRQLSAALLTLSAWSAQADVMDQIDVRREGGNAIVQITMVGPVRIVNTISRAKDQTVTQTYYEMTRNGNAPGFGSHERRVVKAAGLPVIDIAEESFRDNGIDVYSRRLVISLSRPAKLKVRPGKGENLIELVFEGLGPALKATPEAAAEPQSAATPSYVIALIRSSEPDVGSATPIPQALQNQQVFTTRRLVDGKQVYELDLGYFATLAEAEAALKQLGRFPQAVIVKLDAEATAQAPKPSTTAPTTPSAAMPAGKAGESTPQDMLLQARQAYEQQNLADAVVWLTQLLEQPPSAVTQDGQELLGQIRLAQGDPVRAQAEFEAYLKQFPTGPGADRVRAALAGLQPTELKLAPTLETTKPADGKPTVTGSVSQYYYGGKSSYATQAIRDTEGTLLTPDQIDQRNAQVISGVDQRLISTNVDATWRSRTAERDLRLVVRDQYDYNMIDEAKLRGRSRHRNRLTAAYVDYQGLGNGLRGRAGRQSAMWGGEGRYDGASGSYTFMPKWKVSAAAGVPTDVLGQSNRHFMGVALDAEALTPNLSATTFLMQRQIDGEVDRRAVGLDVRYFAQNGNVIATTDYDLAFKKLNTATLGGMYITEGNTTVNASWERRSISPAALGQALFFGYTSLQEAGILPQTISELVERSGYSLAQLRELVRGNTFYSTRSVVTVNSPLTTTWTLGGDLSVSRVGAIAPNEVLANGQAASAAQRTLSLNVIGNNLYSERDSNIFSSAITYSSQVRGNTFSYSNQTGLGESWEFAPSARWQRTVAKDFVSGTPIRTVSWGPGLRATFKPRPNISLESNLNVDYARTEAFSTTDNSTRYSYYLGYRCDY
jgi:hypothetical protein